MLGRSSTVYEVPSSISANAYPTSLYIGKMDELNFQKLQLSTLRNNRWQHQINHSQRVKRVKCSQNNACLSCRASPCERQHNSIAHECTPLVQRQGDIVLTEEGKCMDVISPEQYIASY